MGLDSIHIRSYEDQNLWLTSEIQKKKKTFEVNVIYTSGAGVETVVAFIMAWGIGENNFFNIFNNWSK